MRTTTATMVGLGFSALLLAVPATAQAEQVHMGAVKALHAGFEGGFCKLSPKKYGDFPRLPLQEMYNRFNARSDGAAVFSTMVRGCQSDYQASVMQCFNNPRTCTDEEVAPAQTPAVPMAPAAIPPAALEYDPANLSSVAFCTRQSESQLLSLLTGAVKAAYTKVPQPNDPPRPTVAGILGDMSIKCLSNSTRQIGLPDSPPPAPPVVVNNTAGGANVRVGQQTGVTGGNAAAYAAARQRQAQQQDQGQYQGQNQSQDQGQSQQQFATAGEQALHYLRRGAFHTSLIHLGQKFGMVINPRMYGFTRQPRYAVDAGLSLGFRLPYTALFLIGEVEWYHNFITDDVPEEEKPLVNNNHGFRGGFVIGWDFFADSAYPVMPFIGYKHIDFYPSFAPQPHAFVAGFRFGPFSNYEVLKRVSLFYEARIVPRANAWTDSDTTHVWGIELRPWRNRFRTGNL